MKRLQGVLFGCLIAWAAVALAQTTFASLRVNGTSDLRGNISNGTGSVTVADVFNLSGATSALQLGGSAGTSGQALLSAGAGALPVWGSGGAAAVDFSFTITWDDACTTSPTTAVVATQLGNIVAWRLAAVSGGCASDSANYATTATIVPAAIRPATDVVIMQGWANDTGVNTLGCIVIDSTGTVAAYKDGVSGCVGASWLNAGGTKSYGQNGVGLTSFAYRL